MLHDAVGSVPGVTLVPFSWRTAVLGHYDVFHVHWPEALIGIGRPLKRTARQLLFVVVLTRQWIMGIPLVRTVHNLELPRDISRLQRAILLATERRTALRIRVNAMTEVPGRAPVTTIVHGHYRDWFARFPTSDPVRGRIVFVGAIRRYKDVPALVQAFRDTSDTDLSLRVAGAPSTQELAAEVERAADGDARVHVAFGMLTDAELVDEVGRAELVVLPYREMHNSGSVLATLSLDRPVLVPDNAVNRALGDEVGPGWVHLFNWPLTGDDIEAAIKDVRASPPAAVPNLTAREWDSTGQAHVAAFRSARSRVSARRRFLQVRPSRSGAER